MKGIFESRSAGVKILILLLLVVVSVCVGSICLTIFSAISGVEFGDLASDFYQTHANFLVSDIFTFIAPALVMAYLCSRQPRNFLSIRKVTDFRIILLSIVMFVLIIPTINLTEYLNSRVHLPEFMAPIEDYMKQNDKDVGEIIQNLISEKGVIPLIINFFTIAVMAGLSEELFFRGILLSIIGGKKRNQHAAIWIVALIFSAIHLQFDGFVPRMLLGAFLGYLLLWGRSILIPMFAHFLNNAMNVVFFYCGFPGDSSEGATLMGEEVTSTDLWTMGLSASAGLILFYFCAKAMKRIASPPLPSPQLPPSSPLP